uniref:DDE Tnp4 domain-containing protein n=1 Tax=Acrobeloides nanus TaxID=290746 RepID=A0A914CET6_9BILA
MALVDSDSRFLWSDIGAYGGNNDAFIFNGSQLCQAMDQNLCHIPRSTRLPNSNIRFPFYFIGDEIFALRFWLLKPYGGMNLTEEEQQCNYRLSVGRRVVEQAFGRLAMKFRILGTAPCIKPERYSKIIRSLLVIHNFLIDTGAAEDNGVFFKYISVL